MDEEAAPERTSKRPHRKRPVLLKGGRLMRDKLHGKTFLIPSFITMVAVFCGFLAIISAIKGEFVYAAKCIGLSIVLDGLDGRVARKLNATSSFGREFDSLSDLVAFGVAPAVLVYCWAFAATADEFGILCPFIYTVCCATRLARFNVASESPTPARHFTGLPSPGAAAAIAAVVYAVPDPLTGPVPVAGMMGYMLLIAVLMVSTLSFFSIKHLKLAQGNPRVLVLLAALVALFWKFSTAVILTLSTAYALSGLAGYVWQRYFPRSADRQRSFLGMRLG